MGDEPDLQFIGEPRKRGRPRSAEPSSRLSIWLPTRELDHYTKLAKMRRESLSSTVVLLLRTKWQRSESK